MGRELRPDKCHVMLFAGEGTKFFSAKCDSRFPGAWRRGLIYRLIMNISKKHRVAMTDNSRHYEIYHGEVREMVIGPKDDQGRQKFVGYVGKDGEIFPL